MQLQVGHYPFCFQDTQLEQPYLTMLLTLTEKQSLEMPFFFAFSLQKEQTVCPISLFLEKENRERTSDLQKIKRKRALRKNFFFFFFFEVCRPTNLAYSHMFYKPHKRNLSFVRTQGLQGILIM